MNIANHVLEGIIGHSVVGPNDTGRNRQARRVAVSKRATLSHTGSAVHIPITIIDIAAGGVGFIYLSPLVPGERFILRVNRRNGQPIIAHCMVRWFMKTGNGKYRIGSEFLCLVDEKAEDSIPDQGISHIASLAK
jgi:hypothetical protein